MEIFLNSTILHRKGGFYATRKTRPRLQANEAQAMAAIPAKKLTIKIKCGFVYTVVNRQEIDGARSPLPIHFGARNRYVTTIGNSNHHSLETTLNPSCSFVPPPFIFIGVAGARNPRCGQLVGF